MKFPTIHFRFLNTNRRKVGEAVLVAACSAVILMTMIYALPDCQPVRSPHDNGNHTDLPLTLNDVADGHHEDGAAHGMAEGHNGDHSVHRRSVENHGHGVNNATFGGHSHVPGEEEEEDIYGNHGHGYVLRV